MEGVCICLACLAAWTLIFMTNFKGFDQTIKIGFDSELEGGRVIVLLAVRYCVGHSDL